MRTQMTAADDDADAPGLYQIGGLSAIALGVGYVVIVALYVSVGAPPNDGEAWLRYLSDKTAVWWAILGLSVLTDFLFLPVTFALFGALKGISRNAMRLSATLMGLFVVLDLAVTWSNYASLLTLSDRYAAATTDVQRAGYIAAANYAAALLASRLFVVYAIVVLSSSIFIIGLVMLKGVFSRTTVYLALITGVLGIVSLAGWGVTIILNAVFATVWIFFVGFRLCRLAWRPS